MNKSIDAIIFGASGFSGQVVVEDAIEILKDFRWGIAGRNKTKLETVLKNLGTKINRDLSEIPIIIADVNDENSLKAMAESCKIILNCVGPFHLYGEAVVRACIEAGTHHVDISVEPQYIDKMQLKYHQMAKEKNVYVISNCAFESIPAEMGVIHAERCFSGTINSIEMYFVNNFKDRDEKCKAMLHYGTWESVIFSIKNFWSLFRYQRQMNAELPCPVLRPKLRLKPYIQRPSFSENYFLPTPIGDCDVVERSQRRLYAFDQKRPIQFKTYIGFPSFLVAFFLPIYVALLALLAILPCCHKLLLRFPEFFSFGWFSRQGPTHRNQIGHHYTMIFKAKGWSKGSGLTIPPNRKQLTRLLGINGYGMTSLGVLLAAKMVLKESDKMPEGGGVLPPGAAFHKTSLIDEISKHKFGLQFELVEESLKS